MKKGRPKNIESSEIMWELFEAYRVKIKGNPIKIVEQKRGNVYLSGKQSLTSEDFLKELKKMTIDLPVQRPLTMEGFLNYLDDEGVITDATDYFENKQGRYSDFVRVCSHIRRVIRQDQIEGGMAGIYNPSITQRLNNLTEHTEISAKIELTPKDDQEREELEKLMNEKD